MMNQCVILFVPDIVSFSCFHQPCQRFIKTLALQRNSFWLSFSSLLCACYYFINFCPCFYYFFPLILLAFNLLGFLFFFKLSTRWLLPSLILRMLFNFYYVYLNYHFTFKHFWPHLIKFNLLYSNNLTVKYLIVLLGWILIRFFSKLSI